MKRSIKFRAWDGEKMVNHSFVVHADSGLAITTTEPNGGETLYHDDWKVMQFTGLHDKNGKEIYEGDVVEHTITAPWDDKVPIQVKSKVEWSDDGQWWLDCPAGSDGTGPINSFCSFEVIGNIYENPELIK